MLAGVTEAHEPDAELRAMSEAPKMFHVEHFDPFSRNSFFCTSLSPGKSFYGKAEQEACFLTISPGPVCGKR